jgi:hypothetical protein
MRASSSSISRSSRSSGTPGFGVATITNSPASAWLDCQADTPWAMRSFISSRSIRRALLPWLRISPSMSSAASPGAYRRGVCQAM